MSTTGFAPDTSKPFKDSDLRKTLQQCKSIAGLNTYKQAIKDSIEFWEQSQHKESAKNVIFFSAALEYVDKRLKQLTKKK